MEKGPLCYFYKPLAIINARSYNSSVPFYRIFPDETFPISIKHADHLYVYCVGMIFLIHSFR